MASCAIPGWYQPVMIGDHRFIDAAPGPPPTLTCLPVRAWTRCSSSHPRPASTPTHPLWSTRLERQWRSRVTQRVLRESTTVHRLGTEVTILGPGREDLEAMGGNLMDLSRRPLVIETSLRTSVVALRDPASLPARRDVKERSRPIMTRIYLP